MSEVPSPFAFNPRLLPGSGVPGARRRSRSNDQVEVRPSRHGLGLFALEPVAVGACVLTFEGPHITFAQSVAKGEAMANPLQIGPDLYIDLEPLGVYANHSCDPNAGIVRDRFLVALRPIAAGEEVRFDYSTTVDEDYWIMECGCGALRCRGTIADFKYLPADVQRSHLRAGIVQRFIAERFATSAPHADVEPAVAQAAARRGVRPA